MAESAHFDWRVSNARPRRWPLSHPHIAAIYGIEDGPGDAGAGSRVLAMELVGGEDLSAILARGPLPMDEALPMARQIAEALEAAHAQGVIHRDLVRAPLPDGSEAIRVILNWMALLAEAARQ